MANSKQKMVPEGGQRKPGKTKFSIPRRDAPPVDGSYLERLFADYNRQAREQEGEVAEPRPSPEVSEQQQLSDVTQPFPIQSVAPTQEVMTAASPEVLDARQFEDPVPFPPREIVHAKTEEPPSIAPSELSGKAEATDVLPSHVADLATPPPARQEHSFEDQSLIENWKKRHRLSKGEVKVLQVLVRMCREVDGQHCYVKVPQLMADADLKERQTQLVLRNLRELGLIEKLSEYSNADRMGTQYRIVTEAE